MGVRVNIRAGGVVGGDPGGDLGVVDSGVIMNGGVTPEKWSRFN
jgi:hypothetical protein